MRATNAGAVTIAGGGDTLNLLKLVRGSKVQILMFFINKGIIEPCQHGRRRFIRTFRRKNIARC
jgi:hypothetical protein